MKIYLAGPMRGLPEFNFPAFHAAAARLRAQGHFVFSPAEKDIERHGGVDISKGNMTGSLEQAEAEHGFSRADAIMDDLTFIAREADAIALLPDWEYSGGAAVEHALGKFMRLKFIYNP